MATVEQAAKKSEFKMANIYPDAFEHKIRPRACDFFLVLLNYKKIFNAQYLYLTDKNISFQSEKYYIF